MVSLPRLDHNGRVVAFVVFVMVDIGSVHRLEPVHPVII
jgi:hypothetical protein